MTLEERMQRVEVAFGAQSELVRDLRDSFTVIGELEARQSRLLKEHSILMADHSEWLTAHEKEMREHDLRMKAHDERMREVDGRIERLVSGMGEYMRRADRPQ